MRGWKTAFAATVFAALLSTNALAQETTAPAAEPAATETATPAPEAAPSDAATTTEAPAAPEATTPAGAESAAAPAEEPARIIFFRPGRLTGGAWTYTIAEVGEDGRVEDTSPRVGRLPNGRYFVAEVTPGIHNYNITGPMAVNLAEDRIRLEVESGETYYIEQTVRIGLVTGGFRLVPSTQEEFERRNLREWTPEPSDD